MSKQQLTPKQFYQLIKKDKVVPQILLLTGTSYSLMVKVFEHIKEVLGVTEESIKVFEGKEFDIGELYDHLTVSSLFSKDRLILFRDARAVCGLLREKSLRELLSFAKARKGIYLVFFDYIDEDDKKRDTKAYQLLVEEATIVNCRKPGEKEIREWLKKRLVKLGIKDEDLVDFLIEKTDCSFDLLEKELEKIALFSDRDVVVDAKVYNPFEMVSLALKGDFRAIDALMYLLDSGEYPALILSAIQKKVRSLFLYKLGLLNKVTPYQRMIMEEETKDVSVDELKSIVLASFQLERRIKTGFLDPKKALSDFVLSILMRRVKAG